MSTTSKIEPVLIFTKTERATARSYNITATVKRKMPWPNSSSSSSNNNNNNNNTRTIISVLPRSPRSENFVDIGPSSADAGSGRPVHRVNGRVASRKPDRSVIRSRTVCPFRFRLAWWSRPEPPKHFEELCDNCKFDRGHKLGKLHPLFVASPPQTTKFYCRCTLEYNDPSFTVCCAL